jgi:hypothetical protein
MFIVAILFFPKIRNLYYLRKYKMSFANYDKQFVEDICKNEPCIYVAKFSVARQLIISLGVPILIIITMWIICDADKLSKYYLWILISGILLGHIGWLIVCFEYYCAACYITNTSMFTRNFTVGDSFDIIPLQDIEIYAPYTSNSGLCLHVDIITKHGRIFPLRYLENQDELLDVLKNFTPAIEK